VPANYQFHVNLFANPQPGSFACTWEDAAARLAVHPRFPAGTNVELAAVEAPDRVRILIWERGVGPTEASGTGACAAAVAAMLYGGAARDVSVESPGGTQRVEWRDDGLYLTGWAQVIAEVRWLPGIPGVRS
jgi:diaminopimelate epimerase